MDSVVCYLKLSLIMVKTLHIAHSNTTLLYYKDRLIKGDSLQKVWSIFVFRARHWTSKNLTLSHPTDCVNHGNLVLWSFRISSGKIILKRSMVLGDKYEARGLYHFGSHPHLSCVVALSSRMLHDQLGHPYLSKLKTKMYLELSGLQTLECESCQLGKHVRHTFPKRSE
ncbi:uncharacterized protein LOC106759221 [Vigna radiata var. radiata]|uniref:Uncharacterized protein LOC106759221 n=1 Tax=Vigna radiata var. radiata TaxID=3916 RepID=A0A3Q0EYS6_VIGRR|nr:uncharacterized protein LOC106759221 [Vigna radiata var. radiata]